MKRRQFLGLAAAAAAWTCSPGRSLARADVGPSPIALSSVGSDTMVYLMSFWAVDFKRANPGSRFLVTAPGSGAAPPALLDGSANFGPMSRPMKDAETEAFVRRYGYAPTPLRVAIDTLAVYVHRDNPLPGLTMPQLDAVFSSTRHCGYPRPIARWGDLDLPGDWAGRGIALYGRNVVSGTRAFFAEHALCTGKYLPGVAAKATSADVVHAVGREPAAIGYSGIGYRNPRVRVLPLAERAGQTYVEATPDNALHGHYPLTRALYLYLNKPPGGNLAPAEDAFVRMVLSPAGQQRVAAEGFIPLTAAMADQELAKLA